MPGVEDQHQRTIVDLHLDPLGELLPEALPTAESKRLIRFEPAVPMSDEQAARMPFGATPAPKGRLFVGSVMLGVGLIAGFAVAVATVWQLYGERTTSSPASAEPSSSVGRADAQVPPARPVFERSVDEKGSTGTDDGPVTRSRTSPGSVAAVPTVETPTPGLQVQSRPTGATVYLDGQLVSTTPFQLTDIAPGTYIIRIVQPGYSEWSASVHVERGARTRVSASLELE